MRAVLDCNVVVSGLIRPDRPPAHLLNAFVRERFEVLLSPAILEEYRRVLLSRKVRRYLSLPPDGIEALLASMALVAFWVEDQTATSPIVLADPSDDIYLVAAAVGQVDYVVSGDQHLLSVGRYEGIPIVSPRDFLRTLT